MSQSLMKLCSWGLQQTFAIEDSAGQNFTKGKLQLFLTELVTRMVLVLSFPIAIIENIMYRISKRG